MWKYNKESIITGCVDSYCLVCDSYLRSEEDARSHIEKPVHVKNLAAAIYFQKYQDDRIRKVKKGYFCEFCNLLFSTAAKVGIHIEDQTHTHNKGMRLLRRVGNAVMAANDVFINEKAWNGLIEDTCVICNTEFYNEHIHKTEQNHVLNLIQKEIEFGAGDAIYRKIDNDSFQCLTCNMIFSLTNLAAHYETDEHKMSYAKCREFSPSSTDLEIKYNSNAIFNVTIQPRTGLNQNENTTGAFTLSQTKTDIKKQDTDVNLTINGSEKNDAKENESVDRGKSNKTHNDLKNQDNNDKERTQTLSNYTNKAENGSDRPVTNATEATANVEENNHAKENESIDRCTIKETHNDIKNQDNTEKQSNILPQTIINNRNEIENGSGRSVTNETKASSNVQENNHAKENESVDIGTINDLKIQDNNEKQGNVLAQTSKTEATAVRVQENNREQNIQSNKAKLTEHTPKSDVDSKESMRAVLILKPETNTIASDGSLDRKDIKQYDKAKILDRLPEFQKNGLNINFETETAICKRCFECVELDHEVIEKHIIEHDKCKSFFDPIYTQTSLKDNEQKQNAAQEKLKSFDENHNVAKRDSRKSQERDKAIVKFVPKKQDNVEPTKQKPKDPKQKAKDSKQKGKDSKQKGKDSKQKVKDSKQKVKDSQPKVKDHKPTPNDPKQKATAPKPIVPIEPEDESANFAKANKLTFNKGNTTAYCRLCGSRIPSSLRSMKEHVAGANHKSNLGKASAKLQKPEIPYSIPKKPLKKFLKSIVEIDIRIAQDIVINDKYCLSKAGYHMIMKAGTRFRCQACEVNMAGYEIDGHLELERHEEALHRIPILFSIEAEFIREVRPGLFHCGYCNIMVVSWDEFPMHQQCLEHKVHQRFSNSRLREVMPDIIEDRKHREMSFMRMVMLGHFRNVL